jgi:hypothetical protein
MNGSSRLEGLFPNLGQDNYQLTSPRDRGYNCVAWAAGQSNQWWEPDQFNQYYWPRGIPREYSLEAYEFAYAQLGYEKCQTHCVEDGFEKIAIFTKDGVPTHAARQLESGKWTSKLGRDVDLEHGLHALSGIEYGQVALILKRSRL